jgi:hypothetical protein
MFLILYYDYDYIFILISFTGDIECYDIWLRFKVNVLGYVMIKF